MSVRQRADCPPPRLFRIVLSAPDLRDYISLSQFQTVTLLFQTINVFSLSLRFTSLHVQFYSWVYFCWSYYTQIHHYTSFIYC